MSLCVADGVQWIEQIGGLASLAELGESYESPDGGVVVLPAVLPDSGRVSLDVSGVEGCPVEWRDEEEQKPIVAPDEQTLHGFHGLARPPAVAGAGEDRPGLCDGVDPAFVVRRRSERRSIVEESASVPLPVPRLPLQRSLERSGPDPPPCRTLSFRAPVGDPGELPQVREEK